MVPFVSLWPGCRVDANGNGPTRFRFPGESGKTQSQFLLDVQQTCIDQAPTSEFGRWFNDAKVLVVADELRQLKTIKASAPARESRKADLTIKRLRRENEELKDKVTLHLNELDRLNEESKGHREQIRQLKREIELPDNLDEGIRKLRKENRGLKAEKREWVKTKEKLNDDNQQLRQVNQLLERQSSTDARMVGEDGSSKSRAMPMDNSALDNVTILNHAINLFRDPMRSFIVRQLKRDDFREIKKDMTHLDGLDESAPRTFEKALDVAGGDLSYQNAYSPLAKTLNFDTVIDRYQKRFSNGGSLAYYLREIRGARNRAAHPPPGGLLPTFTGDRLGQIVQALVLIGDAGTATKVKSLERLVR